MKTQNIRPDTHPNVFAWFTLCFKFSDAVRTSWAAGGGGGKGGAKEGAKGKGGDKKGGKGGKKEENKKPAADDDDLDLFGDDDDDEAAENARQAAIDAKAKKSTKKAVIAMSLVLLEVKPIDDTTKLDDVAARIFKEITQDGLFWKTEFKKEPVAFGIFKLIIGFSCEDEKTSVDDIVERIEAFDDMV